MRFAFRRAGFFLLTLWIALTINFLLPRLMPGNPYAQPAAYAYPDMEQVLLHLQPK